MLVEERAANEARQVWFAESVLKFLMERNSVNVLHGQVTSGTLILQDCAVSLLFALLPVLGGTSGVLQGVTYMTKSYLFGDSLRL
ncbi:K(+) efflux antiporter [Arachis hypogaea]|nr:K(+) efflux antiporter [Arachis hypogaea]